MKKIINGKIYDTDKAVAIADYTNYLGTNDVYYESEVLYRTAKGNFFLYGEGGALSRYSEGNNRQSWGSKDIIPFTSSEAYEWLQENNEVEVLEELFSDRLTEA